MAPRAARDAQARPRPTRHPTGRDEPFAALDAPLGELDLDDGFALLDERTSLGFAGGGRRIAVEFLSGFPYAQVFAPKDKDYIALKPMTAPTGALTSGRGLRLVPPGARFEAAFRIRVDPAATSERP